MSSLDEIKDRRVLNTPFPMLGGEEDTYAVDFGKNNEIHQETRKRGRGNNLQLCRIARMRSATIPHNKRLIKPNKFFEIRGEYKLHLKYPLMLTELNMGEVKERRPGGKSARPTRLSYRR
jgi:hypothetical protein